MSRLVLPPVCHENLCAQLCGIQPCALALLFPVAPQPDFMIMVLGLVILDSLDWGPLYVKPKN